MPSSPIRRQAPDVRYSEKVPNVKYPEKVERHKGDRLHVQGVGTPPPDDTEHASLSGALHPDSPKDTWRAPLSGLPQGEAHETLDHHTPDDSISYPDMLSKSLTKVSKPCYSPRSAALRWCVRTSFAGKTPYSLYFGFAYGKGLQSLGSSCF